MSQGAEKSAPRLFPLALPSRGEFRSLVRKSNGFVFESRDPLVVIFDIRRADCTGAYATRAIPRVEPVRVGMTREMVADLLGFPPGYATITDFRRCDVWDYVKPGPFGSKVVFKNGAVSEYDPPGNLP